MEIDIIRKEPVQQPISQVVLHLEPDEYNLLTVMFGRISRNDIRTIWNNNIEDDVVDDVWGFCSDLYNLLRKGK